MKFSYALLFAAISITLSVCSAESRESVEKQQKLLASIVYVKAVKTEFKGKQITLAEFELTNHSKQSIVLPIWKIGEHQVIEYPSVVIQFSDENDKWRDEIGTPGVFLGPSDALKILGNKSAHFSILINMEEIYLPAIKKIRIVVQPIRPKTHLFSEPFSPATLDQQ